jgi:Mg2+ and Co2+ transporter CorA
MSPKATSPPPSKPGVRPPAEPRRVTSIFAVDTDPRRAGREAVNAVLSDLFMAFLSILLLPIILIPLLVPLSDTYLGLLDIGDATIVAFFIAEYFSKLYLSKDRRAHFLEPWHLLDLTIVVLSIVTYLPIFALNGRGSYALLARLIRLPRVFAVAGRTAGSRLESAPEAVAPPPPPKPMVIRQLDPDLRTTHSGLTWEELEARLKDDRPEWIDIHNVPPEGIARLSRMLGVSESQFKTRVMDEIYPHVTFVQKASLLFLQLGELKYPDRPGSFLTIQRSGAVVLCLGRKILTVSPHDLDLVEKVLTSPRAFPTDQDFAVSVLYGIEGRMVEDYKSILSDIELEVSNIGRIPRSKLPKDFLEHAYQLSKEVSRLGSNLIHFRQMLAVIIAKKVPLEGFDARAEEEFQVLHDETQFLDEIAEDLGDRVGSITELYINQEAFETNRILKILAVITSVSVIPAAVSGILGENVLGTPFPATLWEVVLGMSLTMAFIVYSFLKLGWLRA